MISSGSSQYILYIYIVMAANVRNILVNDFAPTLGPGTATAASLRCTIATDDVIQVSQPDLTFISEFLHDENDASDFNAIGNYSGGSPTDFEWTCTQDDTHITRLIVHIEDEGSFDVDGYGAIPSGVITSGIRIGRIPSGGSFIEFSQYPDATSAITSNGLWAALCYDINLNEWAGGNAPRTLNVRWTFARGGVRGIKLDTGDKFVVRLNDSFVGLILHHFCIQGNF